MEEHIRKHLPKAKLFDISWGRRFYFAKFRLANAVRLQIGWFVVHYRAPWLEQSARINYPQLFR